MRRHVGIVMTGIAVLAAACSDAAPNRATPGGGSIPASTGGAAATTTTITPTTSTTSPSSTTTTSSTTTIPPTTTTTIPLVTEGAVVIVANASGVNGAAQRLSDELAALGFHLGKPTNAAGNEEELDVSKVYWMPQAQPVGDSIAKRMGVQSLPMPTPVWIVGGPAALGEATVVVMLGHDLAGTSLK